LEHGAGRDVFGGVNGTHQWDESASCARAACRLRRQVGRRVRSRLTALLGARFVGHAGGQWPAR
jgi:hypothetical protein